MQQIPTPALLVDLDAMEFNLRLMADFFSGKKAKLRPHFKNHKAPLLAWKQLRLGAGGVTCATVREAEILIAHGIDDILVANELAGECKANRFAELSRQASILVAVDNIPSLHDLGRAGRKFSVSPQVLIDIDIGLGRCGVRPGQETVDLARCALKEGLTVRGVMGYEGHLQAQPQCPERDELVRAGTKSLIDSKTMLEAAGIPTDVVSTGGTGTYSVAGQYPGVTEIQAGSYLLMDNLYYARRAPFQRSLTVLASVVSKRGSNHAVIDCGVKELSAERGLSTLKDLPGITLATLHAEHGLLEIEANASRPLAIGQRIELWVHYSDATVNLHSSLYGVRHGQIEEVFEIVH